MVDRVLNRADRRARLAIEVFPPESELTDNANLYHLWCLPVGFELPFALEDRS